MKIYRHLNLAFFAILSLGCINQLLAQGSQLNPEIDYCGAVEEYNINHPDYLKMKIERDKLEKAIKEQIEINSREINGGVITIPVVFHIIHFGSSVGVNENIATSQVMDQLNQLNDDFRYTNSNASNTIPAFAGVAADTEIEFCLTQVDQIGYPSTGIRRYDVNNLTFVEPDDCWTLNYIDRNIKRNTIWDRDRFLNIWVVPQFCSPTLLGYAQYPGEDADTDGVLVHYSTIGSLAYPNLIIGDYNKGRVLTHEVGHFLNLYHTFQAGCSNLDQVSDTPAIENPSRDCFTTQSTCGSLDMIQNHMDYTFDACKTMFTAGQKDRMIASLQLMRPTLMNAYCDGPVLENDLCPDAILAFECNTYQGTTIGAVNSGAGQSCSAGSIISPGVWYRIIGDGSVYTASTCDAANFDTVIDVYSGSCGSLNCLAGNDQACGGGTSEVSFNTLAGANYYIYVRSYFAGGNGNFQLSIYKSQIVTSAADDGPGSLRQTIACATPGQIITFSNTLDNTPIVLTSETILMDRDIIIQGNPSGHTHIEGAWLGKSIFRFNGDNISLRNLKLTNGGSETTWYAGALESSGNTNIVNCIFENNVVKLDGGAVNVYNANQLNIVNSTFRNNEALEDQGGAIFTAVRNINFNNNLFINNAANEGGTIFFKNNPLENISLVNNTIANNTASQKGGGIYTKSIDEVHNNIIAGNIAPNGPDCYSEEIANSTNNLMQDTTDSNVSTGFIIADPLFNNAVAGDFSLTSNSLCIDGGNNINIPIDDLDIDYDANTTETVQLDIIGNPRLLNQIIDMGAIESIPEACESAISINCGSFSIVDFGQSMATLNCGPTYRSAFYSIRSYYENTISLTLSNYSNNKYLYLYDSLCGNICSSVSSSTNTGSSTQSINYTLSPGTSYYLEVHDLSATGGEADLEFDCLSDPCNHDLYLTSPFDDVDNGITDFTTDGNIIAKNAITQSGDSYFIAGSNANNYIELIDGFEVMQGGLFQTFSTGCN